MGFLDFLIDALLMPPVVILVLIGIGAAFLLYWLAPPGTDVTVPQAFLVAGFFLAGLFYAWWHEKDGRK